MKIRPDHFIESRFFSNKKVFLGNIQLLNARTGRTVSLISGGKHISAFAFLPPRPIEKPRTVDEMELDAMADILKFAGEGRWRLRFSQTRKIYLPPAATINELVFKLEISCTVYAG